MAAPLPGPTLEQALKAYEAVLAKSPKKEQGK